MSVFLALGKSKPRVIWGQLKTLTEKDSVLEHKQIKPKKKKTKINEFLKTVTVKAVCLSQYQNTCFVWFDFQTTKAK